jgi:hypothetical protein
MPLTRSLEITRYKSTKEANESLTHLAQLSGWPDHMLSRLAISRSLRISTVPSPPPRDRKGKELRGQTLFQARHDPDYLPWIAAMIAQHTGRPFRSDDEAVELILAHWHRGVDLLRADLDQHNGAFNETLLALARRVREELSTIRCGYGESPESVSPAHDTAGPVRPITVPIGCTSPDSPPFCITLNDTRKFSNSHFAVSGMSGSGKTQFVKQILSSAASSCDRDAGIIFIDFAKGDVAGNQKFVSAIGAQVVRLPGEILPIGPFHLPDYSNGAIRLAAEEKREAYTHLFRMLGPKQQGRLAEAIRQSYEDLVDSPEPAPDFAYVQQKLRDIYSRDGVQPDSLTELFRQLNAYRLFWSRELGSSPASPLHTQRWVVDIHELGGLREVTAFSLIEQLYREMRDLPDSTVDEESGYREIRCILAIDEAQYYLRARNRFLQGIIREGRSKGFVTMLMCQSPGDFDQDDFDYTEQLQFTYMLQCKTEARAVQRLLGVSREEARRLTTDLGRMEPLFGIGRHAEHVGGTISRFRIVPFFEHIQRM